MNQVLQSSSALDLSPFRVPGPHPLAIGEEVAWSPVGAGTITGFSEEGYPQINGRAVAWLQTKSGKNFRRLDGDVTSSKEICFFTKVPGSTEEAPLQV